MFEQRRLWMMVSCLTVLLTACGDDGDDGGESTTIIENTADLCSDDVDNDKDGMMDCDDPGCKDFAFCQATEDGKENTLAACKDEKDNDGDGKTDCDDEDCKDFTICQEGEAENTLVKCQDGKDNDKDGLMDCDDSECKAFSVCSGSGNNTATENSAADCLDGEDNDGDGKIDCDDEGCRVFSFCANAGSGANKDENTLKACTDGEDNDDDGDIDCLDMDCRQFEVCAPLVGVKENTRELCSDGLDNDYNGATDCADVSCRLFCRNGGATGENTVELCKDGLDNDGDGKADCEETECAEYDFCLSGYPKDDPAKDECPKDPYKFKKDQCECGQTLMENGDCYTNIVEPDDLADLMKYSKNGAFIIKRDLDFGTTDKQFNIEGFNGTFDGGNHRITGVFYQKGPNCSLFAGSPDHAVFKNVDIAITLNCDNIDTTSPEARVGALFGTFKGVAQHITGSSKVYVEENKSATAMTLESDHSYHKAVGGLIGLLSEGEVSDITLNGNVSVYYPSNNYKYTSSSTPYAKMYYEVGGVVGRADSENTLIKDVWANAFVTVDRNTIYMQNITNNYGYVYTYMGGAIGNSKGSVDNIHNSGTVMYYPRDNRTSVTSAVGGIVGRAKHVVNSSFNGKIYVDRSRSDEWLNNGGSDKNYQGLKVGGILGYIDGTKGIGIDNCQVDAEIETPIYNASIGGIVGALDSYTNNVYVRNSSARVDLILRNLYLTPSTTAYGSYGGIAGTAYRKEGVFDRTAYLINNSARTNYIQSEELNLSSIEFSVAGICPTIGYYNGGVVVNNFASDKLTCSDVEGCYYMPKAIGGSYVYESYWNETLFGNNPGSSDYFDASAESYTYNAENIPITRSGNTVLGLLRYNAGHEGGVLSAHIPNDGTYLNWTTITDDDGHVIPVPEPAYVEID